MPKIQDIAVHPSVKRRRIITFEDREPITLGRKSLAALGWGIGDVVAEEAIVDALVVHEGPSALDRAFYYLGSRARSEREVEDFLRSRAYEPEAIDHAMAKLKDYGYVDDQQLAEELVRNAAEVGRFGRRALSPKLRHRGLSEETVRAAVEAQYSVSDESENAEELAEKLWFKYRNEADLRKRKAKVQAALARRGYGWDSIGSALRAVMATEDDDEG